MFGKWRWLSVLASLALTALGCALMQTTRAAIPLAFAETANDALHLDLAAPGTKAVGLILAAAGALLFGATIRSDCAGSSGEAAPAKVQTPRLRRWTLILPIAGAGLGAWQTIRAAGDLASPLDGIVWMVTPILFVAFFALWEPGTLGEIVHRAAMRWRGLLLLGILLAACGVWLNWSLDAVPQGLIADERFFWQNVRRLYEREGGGHMFAPGIYTFAMPSLYWQAAFAVTFGPTLWAWRFASVIAAVIGLAGWGLLLLGWFGARVMTFGILITAALPYTMAYARLGYNNSQSLVPVAFGLLFYALAVDHESVTFAFLGGCAAGLGFYTYTAAQIAPAILALYTAYMLIKTRKLRALLRTGTVYAFGMGLVAAPLWAWAAWNTEPTTLGERVLEGIFANTGYGELYDDALETTILLGRQALFFDADLYPVLLVRGAIRSILSLYDGALHEGRHFLQGPLAGALTGTFFTLGIGAAAARFRDRRRALLLVGAAACTALLGALSSFPPRPAHMLPIVLFIGGLAALALDQIAQNLGRLGSAFAVLALVGMIIWGGIDYFVLMPKAQPPRSIDDILLWEGLALRERTMFLYLYDDAGPPLDDPWGLHYFNTLVEWRPAHVDEIGTLSTPGAFPTRIFVTPSAWKSAHAALEAMYGPLQTAHTYRDPRGIAILIAAGRMGP